MTTPVEFAQLLRLAGIVVSQTDCTLDPNHIPLALALWQHAEKVRGNVEERECVVFRGRDTLFVCHLDNREAFAFIGELRITSMSPQIQLATALFMEGDRHPHRSIHQCYVGLLLRMYDQALVPFVSHPPALPPMPACFIEQDYGMHVG